MKRLLKPRQANFVILLSALAISAVSTGSAVAAPAPPDEAQLLALGFKVLVATTPAQEDWVRNLSPGHMRAMQRTGKHFFIYPDAARNRVYVGGPKEYQAYQVLYPDDKSIEQQREQEQADGAYRSKQDTTMEKATARDESDPFLGLGWADLVW